MDIKASKVKKVKDSELGAKVISEGRWKGGHDSMVVICEKYLTQYLALR